MKKYSKISYLFLFLLLSSKTYSQNQISWYKHFVGSIDKYPIVVHLHKMGDKVKGYYYYDSQQRPIAVSGTSKNGRITLDSYIIGADVEEKFDLVWQGTSLVGSWKTKEKTLNASLKEFDDQSFKYEFILVEGEKKMFPKLEDSPSANFEKATIWPQGNSALSSMLKQWVRRAYSGGKSSDDIGKIFLKQKATFFADYDKEKVTEKEAKESGASYSRSEESNVTVAFQTEKLLSLAKSDYSFEGGAHGNWGISYTSFDITTNKELKIKDIISSAGQSLLPKLLEKAYRNTYKIDAQTKLTESLFEDKINPNDNFYVTSKGICFAYLPYEIAAYAHGQIELFIPFTQLSAHLQPKFKTLL
jgi:Protein of unknown function (DUF3298)/Deacetylase PdaC